MASTAAAQIEVVEPATEEVIAELPPDTAEQLLFRANLDPLLALDPAVELGAEAA